MTDVHAVLHVKERLQAVLQTLGRRDIGALHQTMLDAVNHEREAVGKSQLGVDAVITAERPALGHTDYELKFSLYCARLVVELE